MLIVGCSLTPQTQGLVNAEFLSRMKSSAVIVNIGRGPIVDSDALAKALSEGKIFGAGLDVVAGEPNVPSDHPLVKEPRCVVLPHIGSANQPTREAMASTAVDNVFLALEGKPMYAEVL